MPLAAVLVPLATRLPRRRFHAVARAARARALRASAAHAGAPAHLPFEDWPALASGAPRVIEGWHASMSDTTGLVAALVAPVPAAIDAEWLLRPRYEAARERFRASGELARLGAEDRGAVLALWTAKEAVLKLAGTGIADLGRCPLVGRQESTLYLEHRGRAHAVRVLVRAEHVIACAAHAPIEIALVPLEEVA